MLPPRRRPSAPRTIIAMRTRSAKLLVERISEFNVNPVTGKTHNPSAAPVLVYFRLRMNTIEDAR
jgi:hypothetical protein